MHLRRKLAIHCCVFLGLLAAHCLSIAGSAPTVVRYPKLTGDSVVTSEAFNPVSLLKEALRRSAPGTVLEAHEYTNAMSLSRVYSDALEGKNIDVIWRTTTTAREAELLAVRIPIDKGLFGWRIALIRSADQDKWTSALRAATSHDWWRWGFLSSGAASSLSVLKFFKTA
jgi:hypothetical protein